MRILVLNYEFPPLGGGAAPVSKDISVRLKEAGHFVTVVTMGYKDLPGYEAYHGVKIYRLKCLRKNKNVCRPWEQYSYLLAVRRFLKKHMREHSYDVCHAHFVVPTGEAARLVKKQYHIPYVVTAHGSDVEGHNRKVAMRVMHRILRKRWKKIVKEAEAVTAPSEYLEGLMRDNYPYGRYRRIPNGLDWMKWHSLDQPGCKEKRILIMGRLQKFKNVQMILHALARVEFGEWGVDILGDGPYRRELERQAQKEGLSDKVRFCGWIDSGTKEQLSYVQRASIYISASMFENFPMSVAESAAAGCIPLVSDIPAHRALLETEACFFGLGDIKGLAGKIKGAMEYARTGSYQRIDMSCYDWGKVMAQYEEILLKASDKAVNNFG